MTRRHIRLAPLALALMVAACHSNPSTSPTTTTGGLTTETFNGTVAVGGSDSKTFTVAVTGVVSVTLTAASPSVTMGLGVGQPGGASGCVLLPGGSTTATAGTLAQLAGEVTPGTFCVQVYDVGNQTVPVSYTVTVAHP
jgi:hypothetical protein